jgi:hypothetical protein
MVLKKRRKFYLFIIIRYRLGKHDRALQRDVHLVWSN